jgi:hypothetical protein
MNVNITPASIQVNVGSNGVSASLGQPVAREYVERPPYEGPSEVTPSSVEQILLTKNYRMTENIKVKPIPSNYGLITWDGSTITVS